MTACERNTGFTESELLAVLEELLVVVEEQLASGVLAVRRKTPGRVTTLAREAHLRDKAEQIANRKRKATEQRASQIAKQARTARDKAEETASHSLCTSLTVLDVQLKARNNSKESRIFFLKEQIYARIASDQPRLYPNLGSEWRKVGGKIRINPASKDQTLEEITL